MKLDRTQSLLAAGLLVSVLANVFLVGFVVANLAQRDRPGPEQRWRRGPGEPPPFALLFEGHREELGETRQQIREARWHVREALLAEPFVVADLERSLNELQEKTSHAQTTLHKVLVARASELTPEQRASLAHAHRLWAGPPGDRRPPHMHRNRDDGR